ncbi:MAG: DUF5134 domain-containing protein [Pseudonocardiales bacterium]
MWVRWIFSVACLAVVGYHAAALIAHSWARRANAGGPYRAEGQRRHELSHLAMAVGMAAMFSPFGDPVPPLVWLIVFGMAAAWFAACLLHAGTPAQGAAEHQYGQHHLVANLAMLFMVVGGHQHGTGGVQTGGVQTGDAAGGSVGAGHEGHIGGLGGGWIEGPIGAVLIVLLAGYFAVHTVRSLRVLFSAPTPGQQVPSDAAGTGPVTVIVARSAARQSRVQAASHVVMAAAMTVMFGLML